MRSHPMFCVQTERLLVFVIGVAEASMPRKNFRAFKKVIFDHYHQVIIPQLHQELEAGDSNKVGAVPNEDRKGVLR